MKLTERIKLAFMPKDYDNHEFIELSTKRNPKFYEELIEQYERELKIPDDANYFDDQDFDETNIRTLEKNISKMYDDIRTIFYSYQMAYENGESLEAISTSVSQLRENCGRVKSYDSTFEDICENFTAKILHRNPSEFNSKTYHKLGRGSYRDGDSYYASEKYLIRCSDDIEKMKLMPKSLLSDPSNIKDYLQANPYYLHACLVPYKNIKGSIRAILDDRPELLTENFVPEHIKELHKQRDVIPFSSPLVNFDGSIVSPEITIFDADAAIIPDWVKQKYSDIRVGYDIEYEYSNEGDDCYSYVCYYVHGKNEDGFYERVALISMGEFDAVKTSYDYEMHHRFDDDRKSEWKDIFYADLHRESYFYNRDNKEYILSYDGDFTESHVKLIDRPLRDDHEIVVKILSNLKNLDNAYKITSLISTKTLNRLDVVEQLLHIVPILEHTAAEPYNTRAGCIEAINKYPIQANDSMASILKEELQHDKDLARVFINNKVVFSSALFDDVSFCIEAFEKDPKHITKFSNRVMNDDMFLEHLYANKNPFDIKVNLYECSVDTIRKHIDRLIEIDWRTPFVANLTFNRHDDGLNTFNYYMTHPAVVSAFEESSKTNVPFTDQRISKKFSEFFCKCSKARENYDCILESIHRFPTIIADIVEDIDSSSVQEYFVSEYDENEYGDRHVGQIDFKNIGRILECYLDLKAQGISLHETIADGEVNQVISKLTLARTLKEALEAPQAIIRPSAKDELEQSVDESKEYVTPKKKATKMKI